MDNLLKQLKIDESGLDKIKFVGTANFIPTSDGFQKTLPIPLVSDIVFSPTIQKKEHEIQRKVVDVSYRYLMQLAFFDAAVKASDRVYEKLEKTKSAEANVATSSSLQSQIICSRIALECFFDLIYVCSQGSRMGGKKGKFKTYRSWVTSSKSEYQKFVPLIIAGFEFDRIYRTPEVHGTSKFPYAILDGSLKKLPIWRVRFSMTNALRMSWGTLIDILYQREGGVFTRSQDADLIDEIFKNSKSRRIDFEKYLKDILSERMK